MLAYREGEVVGGEEQVQRSHPDLRLILHFQVYLELNKLLSILITVLKASYIIERVVGCEEVFAATRDEVMDDAVDIPALQVLHGVAAENKVVAALKLINDNIMNLINEQ